MLRRGVIISPESLARFRGVLSVSSGLDSISVSRVRASWVTIDEDKEEDEEDAAAGGGVGAAVFHSDGGLPHSSFGRILLV